MTDSSDVSVSTLIADPPWLPLSGVVQPGARSTERIAFEPGLSNDELNSIEERLKFVFPPDLRGMLSAALPISEGFPKWRSA